MKIEKRVNYDPYTNVKSNQESSASKYQHNVIWKEQPTIKTEDQLNGNSKISEQKKTLRKYFSTFPLQQLYILSEVYRSPRAVELLQTANKQKITSQTQNQSRPMGTVIKPSVPPSNNAGTAPLAQHKNHTNQITSAGE